MGVTIPRQKGPDDIKILAEPSKVALTFNPSIWKTEADKSLSLRSTYIMNSRTARTTMNE